MKKYTILIDSSVSDLSVAIARDSTVLASTQYDAWQKQSELMVDELDKLLIQLSISRDEIKDICVGVGPGSYTGVRISLTIAKVISLALHVPIYPMSSLQILSKKDCPSICLINARSGRSYIGVYNNEHVIVKDCIMSNSNILTYISEHKDYRICGDVSYLNLTSERNNIFEQMLLLKETSSSVNDPNLVKPVYLKE